MSEPMPLIDYTLPSQTGSGIVGDARAEFAKITQDNPIDEKVKSTFATARTHSATNKSTLVPALPDALVNKMSNDVKKGLDDSFPDKVPGGVGYGMYYSDSFKWLWDTGSSLNWDIICPPAALGNVQSQLFVTATNRTAKGVEALLSYNGQAPVAFAIFDWAREDPNRWQLNIPLAHLGDYLVLDSFHGKSYQVIRLVNTTLQLSSGNWQNHVVLWNNTLSQWHVVYSYNYSSTTDVQKGNTVPWGPIIETFQDLFKNTSTFGALQTGVASRDTNNNWSTWQLLVESNSHARDDEKGFQLADIEKNYSWIANSDSISVV